MVEKSSSVTSEIIVFTSRNNLVRYFDFRVESQVSATFVPCGYLIDTITLKKGSVVASWNIDFVPGSINLAIIYKNNITAENHPSIE